MTARLDYILFGYRKITLAEAGRARALNCLLSAGLSAKVSPEGVLFCSEVAYKRYAKALSGTACDISEPRGLYGFLYKNRKRYGAMAALAMILVIWAISSALVWDIRPDTDTAFSAEELTYELRRAGFEVGSIWHGAELDKIEQQVLAESDKIGWISINRRGTVAYISAKSKSDPTLPPDTRAANIVAREDCVIEQITVKSGVAMVKVGDVVKAGDLLISGVIPEELGGGAVRAEGEVIGRTARVAEAYVARDEEYKAYLEEKISSFGIKIFGKCINIFKIHRNLDKEYDIIKKEQSLTALGGTKLPISAEREYIKEYSIERHDYSEGELTALCRERLAQARAELISDCEPLKLSTSGGFTEGGYAMRCEMLVLSDVRDYRIISE